MRSFILFATLLSPSLAKADGDGLAEVNALRASRGLRPFLRDEGLTKAAQLSSQFRAQHALFGHTSNDFAFVPAGVRCDATGCAAYPASYGWMICCTNDPYTSAGAYWSDGRDGKRYMHLFVSATYPSAFKELPLMLKETKPPA